MNTQNELWRETTRVLGLWKDEILRLFEGRRVSAVPVTPHNERTTSTMRRHLYRSRDDRMVRGVCAGLAEYLGVPAALVRIAFVVLALPGFIHMAIIYAVLMLVIPEAPWEEARR